MTGERRLHGDTGGLANADPAARLAAVKALAETSSPTIKSVLLPLTEKAGEPDDKVRYEAIAAVKAIDSRLAMAENVGRAFSGLSLGSILLLGALGLAITYGVMGIINMAHGELLMVGAYATYGMQTLFRAYFPEAIDWYLPAAIPVDSFMVVVLGGVGQLAGTVYAALGLGILNKLLEGWAGAVLAKIMVLVFIVIFIQKRPQGLFAIKGRSAEA